MFINVKELDYKCGGSMSHNCVMPCLDALEDCVHLKIRSNGNIVHLSTRLYDFYVPYDTSWEKFLIKL